VIVDTTVRIDYLRGRENNETEYFDRELGLQRFGLVRELQRFEVFESGVCPSGGFSPDFSLWDWNYGPDSASLAVGQNCKLAIKLLEAGTHSLQPTRSVGINDSLRETRRTESAQN
jgi:hypothetical protein